MSDERKTLEQRHQMTDIERLRHSAAHVLATAILRIWPEAQFAAGPPVENGFYYDVELPHRISPEDFEKIEAEMKKEIKANHIFERVGGARATKRSPWRKAGGSARSASGPAAQQVQDRQHPGHSRRAKKSRSIATANSLDLCAGPHVMRTGNIGAFKLTHVASAYYKGDEKNPQLQRIYGTAFKNKTELEAYFTMLEEAKKRDHRKLGKELELFTFDDDVGPGLPLWLPRGTVLIEELEKLAKETEFAAGYRARAHSAPRAGEHVSHQRAPALLRGVDVPADGARRRADEVTALRSMHQKATNVLDEHLQAQALTFTQPIASDVQFEQAINAVDRGKATFRRMCSTRSNRRNRCQTRLAVLERAAVDRYYLKAMNCPHHHKLFGAVPRSYRDLPLRLAEYGTCYRYEQSGELFGLMRVRSHADERRPHLLHRGAVRGRVQRGERDVSEVLQDLRHREIRRCASPPTTRRSSARSSSMNPSSG